MKRVTVVALLLLSWLFASPVYGNPPQVLPGDANGDGAIDAVDITKIERIICGMDAVTPGSDANRDGTINALDVTTVERMIAGLD